MKHDPIVIQGELELIESEGGFAPMDIQIDGDPLSNIIAEATGHKPPKDTRGYVLSPRSGTANIGKVIVTIQFIEDV